MSESDWATSTDPQSMLTFLRDWGPVSERKLRLFAVSCCRRVWHLLTDERSRLAVEVAERFAGGLADEEERNAARRGADAAAAGAVRARNGADDIPELFILAARAVGMAVSSLGQAGPDMAKAVVAACSLCSRHPASGLDRTVEHAAYCNALRDTFGNPSHPVSFSPEWRTEIVAALARGIYEERAWDRMGVLSDALEEVGADPELVRHCREPGTHVRGCHVLDAAMDRA